MFVGEQPGDSEDLAGEPFVGPRGKRRIHERPRQDEILACRYWLDQEIEQLKPSAIVALGATSAATLLGSSVRVTRDRAKPFPSPLADLVTLTVHPSSILRSDPEDRAMARRQFVSDLRAIHRLIHGRQAT